MPEPGDLSAGTPGFRERWVRERVFRDKRGRIHQCGVGGMRFNVLTSKAGTYRAGDYHSVQQFDVVLSGLVHVYMTARDDPDFGGKVVTLQPHTLLVIPPEVPHLFRFDEDTVMLEWWDGPFEATYYEPYRAIVEGRVQP